MERRSLTVAPPELAAESLGFFRWGRVAGRMLVTNDAGDWARLSDAEFQDLLAGRIGDGHARFAELQSKGFLRDGLDLDGLAARLARRTPHLRRGPHLHVVTLTRRGADAPPAADAPGLDMSAETASRIVDLALRGTSPSVTFALQGHGGEPLRNFDVLRHLVEYAREQSRQTAGKTLRFEVLSNFSAMNEDAAEWMIAHEVLVSTGFDGPASVHDWNRRWKGGSPHAEVVRWMDYFTRRYAELGRDAREWHVDALLTTTRRTLEAWREVVDEYAARGLRTIRLRPLERTRFDRDTWAAIGYTSQDYLDFRRRVLDYVLELNRRGVEISERMAAVVLSKMLAADDPGAADLQSPNGAGTAQIAYDVDGRVFPCDEARVVDSLGDPFFELGHVRDLSLEDVVRHPTVRAIAAASLLDAQPMCADCWNKPFCGFSPVRNFVTQGDLFGQRPRCLECKEHMAVSTRLFELLADDGDAESADVLRRWTAADPRFAGDARVAKDAP